MRTGRVLTAVLLSALFVAGCASYGPEPERERVRQAPSSPAVLPPVAAPPAVVQPPASRQPAPGPQSAPIALPAAARSLSAQAQRASEAGDHEAAAGYLERALRIAPNHPVLWQHLAVVRYRQHDYGKVEGLALKSNTLAVGNPTLQASNWRLIAEVRRLQGDRQGEQAALAEVRRLTSASGAH